MPNVQDLTSLTKQRGVYKGQLTRFRTFLNNFKTDPEREYSELEVRIQKLDVVWSNYENAQTEIEIITGDDSQDQDREEFESLFFKILGEAKSVLQERPSNQATLPSSGNISNDSNTRNLVKTTVNLPILNTPEFSGAYDQWFSFVDTFEALIGKNQNLSKVEKFYYLQRCLRADAEQVIKNIEVTDSNYDVAWDLLRQRFENKKLIVDKHIQALLEVPGFKGESHVALRKIVDAFQKNIRSLKSLGQLVDTWDTILIFICMQKVDTATKREWAAFTQKDEFPTLKQLFDFLIRRCEVLEKIHSPCVETNSSHFKPPKATASRSFSHVSVNQISCAFCKSNHFNYQCSAFLKMPVEARLSEVRRSNLCTNCLRPGHTNKQCKSGFCKICNKKHSSLLHLPVHKTDAHNIQESLGGDRNKNDKQRENTKHSRDPSGNDNLYTSDSDGQSPGSNTYCTHATQGQTPNNQQILSTALINVFDRKGDPVTLKALLDPGSQSSFVTQDAVLRLKLKTRNVDITVQGIGQATAVINKIVHARIGSLNSNYQSESTFLVIDQISGNIPATSFDANAVRIPDNIKLADPTFFKAGPVDVLLGVEFFWDILGQNQIKTNTTIFQETKLGWVLAGKISFHTNKSNQVFVGHIANGFSDIENFWKIEEVTSSTPRLLTREENECEIQFKNTYTRDETGRFSVDLPIRENVIQNIGNTQGMAIKRFYSLERKLSQNQEFKELYSNFMQEYQMLGHMSEIPANEIDATEGSVVVYLPHHAVMKYENDNAHSPKVRCVFDGWARGDNNLSLNDVLKVGPVIQDDLFDIVLRFRKHNFVFTADISKMYRQINVNEAQRDFQRILWRSDPAHEMKHYRLNTLTYGTAPASFLAIRVLQEVATLNQNEFPDACDVIKSSFWVDDLLTGADTIEAGKLLRRDIINVLKSAQFPLHKWNSNCTEIINDGEISHKGPSERHISVDQNAKVLGLLWNSSLDTFGYKVDECELRSQVTKRTILSGVARVFDPLGMLGPITMRAKILIQHLWQSKIGWDDPVPKDVYKAWKEFREHLISLGDLSIPRQVTIANFIDIQLHGYCDASMKGYGAVTYVRTTGPDGRHHAKILCAKSRVAPLKIISLPRLELCAAVLLARLTHKVIHALKINFSNIFLWSDSTITLSWVKSEPNKFKTFVANRITEIQELTSNAHWSHVSSEENPADVLSRGISPQEIHSNELWWSGPKWLSTNEWPQSSQEGIQNFDLPEQKTIKVFNFCATLHSFDLFERFSSFNKLLRVTAFCLRFARNCKLAKSNRLVGELTVQETDNALRILIKPIQISAFGNEISLLQKSQSISRKSKILSLNPFLDENHQLLRVGGRIRKSCCEYDKVHPYLLPDKHAFCELLIRHEHERLFHAGPQAVLFSLRQKFWIINAKNAIKKVIHKCVICFKAKPIPVVQPMGELPESRLKPKRAFSVCGVDFCGPFKIKNSIFRNRKEVKVYICIFVCFVTKAVHLELSGELTTDSFLNVLKRFISRRGITKHIYSDHGSNFVGAENELKQALDCIFNSQMDKSIKTYLLENAITWHKIPPRSASFGGLWEAAVKSAKFHLKRILNNTLLTFEQFSTIITQIEAILNSRPITPISNDPNDLLAICPSHFLIGDVLTAIPEETIGNIPDNRLNQYQHLQKMYNHFWKRWSHDYLTTLQNRTKWSSKARYDLLPGQLVIIKEDILPPLLWKMGRIVEVHRGADNIVRVVTVKTRDGVYKRGVGKVCVLPTNETINRTVDISNDSNNE